MDWLANGYRYRAGEELEATRDLVRPAAGTPAGRLEELRQRDPTAIASRFWRDGMVRVSGREYSGMLESACAQRGGGDSRVRAYELSGLDRFLRYGESPHPNTISGRC